MKGHCNSQDAGSNSNKSRPRHQQEGHPSQLVDSFENLNMSSSRSNSDSYSYFGRIGGIPPTSFRNGGVPLPPPFFHPTSHDQQYRPIQPPLPPPPDSHPLSRCYPPTGFSLYNNIDVRPSLGLSGSAEQLRRDHMLQNHPKSIDFHQQPMTTKQLLHLLQKPKRSVNSSSENTLSSELRSKIVVSPDKARPNHVVKVMWNCPEKDYALKKMFVGLFRLGQSGNDNSIISKYAEPQQEQYSNSNGMKHNTITFRAPRSAGRYEFRLYSQETDQNSAVPAVAGVTRSTSNTLTVLVQGKDLKETIQFINKRLKSKETRNTSITQLNRLIEQLEVFQPAQITPLIQCIHTAFECSSKSNADCDSLVYSMLSALKSNSKVWNFVPETLKINFDFWLKQYCHLAEKSFRTEEEKAEYWETKLGILPFKLLPNNLSLKYMHNLNLYLHDMLKKLMPSSDYALPRQQLLQRLREILKDLPWKDWQLEVFGSSQNNFGTANSDLDMCLIFPSFPSIEIIDYLCKLFTQAQMLDVEDRRKARVPIVIFKDPFTGINCDIGINNHLALRNTALLRAYSVADPRVREVSFLVKHWAKQRSINSPSDGTLSSYGYILMVIAFFQQLNPPIVPVLQNLPPDWDGSSNIKGISSSTTSSLPSVKIITRDHIPHETYFFEPINSVLLDKLHHFGAKNQQSVAELLCQFFYYYAFEFDCGSRVISVRVGESLDKETKYTLFGWKRHRRFSIEDPFEISYDVAHVLRESRHRQIKKEFALAYSHLSRASLDIEENGFEAAKNCMELLCQIPIHPHEENQEIAEN